MTYQPIKKWVKDDRPREKLALHGPSVLSDAELLAVLIRVGRPGRSALDLARDLIERNRLGDRLDIQRMGTLRLADFTKVKGIGWHTAVTIMAAIELGRRRESINLPTGASRLQNAKSVVQYLRPLLKDFLQETFVVVYLNQANFVKHVEWLSTGGIASTVIDTRLVLRVALEQSATGLILCHNHPGGSLKPSQADIAATRRVNTAAALLDIRLIDHLILTEKGYCSLADEGHVGAI
jgi:DNA repair protein RadC